MVDCLFCKLVAGTIPVQRMHDDEQCLAFPDLSPQAPTHVLVIPKKHIASTAQAEIDETHLLGHLLSVAAQVARDKRLEGGYRIVINTGNDAGQSVEHLHLHLLGGRQLSWPPG